MTYLIILIKNAKRQMRILRALSNCELHYVVEEIQEIYGPRYGLCVYTTDNELELIGWYNLPNRKTVNNV